MSYALEKMSSAVRSLAVFPERLQERLVSAYKSFGHLESDQFPPTLRTRYAELVEKMTCIPGSGGTGAAAATCAEMSDDEAMDAAREILFFSEELERWEAPGTPGGTGEWVRKD